MISRLWVWLVGGVMLLPLIVLVSRTSPSAVVELWQAEPVGRWLTNSMFIAGASTLLACLLSSLAGFALAFHDFRGRRIVLGILLAMVLLPGHTLLPGLAKATAAAGLLDSPIAVILPGSITAFGVFLYTVAFRSVSRSVVDAARLDGGGELRLWWSIALPSVLPTSAAFMLLHFLGQWNALLWPAAVLLQEGQHTLPIGIAAISSQATYEARPDLLAAATLIAILPPMLWFVICEREFADGMGR